jgi:hypothetical protein
VKPKIPRHVDILGHRFALTVSPTDTAGEPWKKGSDKEFGETAIYEYKIALNDSQTPEQLNSTRLHEYLHAILHVSGLNNMVDDKLEEAIVQAIEHGLAPLVRFK